MKQFGLIGFPLKHSFSPQYFNEQFEAEQLNCHYKAFPIEQIELLPSLLHQFPNLQGLNVTIPYKTAVIPFLDAISDTAQNIHAVNCIKIQDKKLIGFNTDYYGFTESLKPLLDMSINKALVLGTGGSAQAVLFALKQLDIATHTVSSSGKGDLSYRDLDTEIMQSHQLIINTTPLGMFPHLSDSPPIPYHLLNEKHILFDLIYNPAETLFLKKGAEQYARTANGVKMLQLQADKSWEIWNSEKIDEPILKLK
ncbi:MAG: shikimate dehydrogenase [Phycisphaerales bacterium]|nr:shikimate dehydrogenase [Phycisphaerales bacterium]